MIKNHGKTYMWNFSSNVAKYRCCYRQLHARNHSTSYNTLVWLTESNLSWYGMKNKCLGFIPLLHWTTIKNLVSFKSYGRAFLPDYTWLQQELISRLLWIFLHRSYKNYGCIGTMVITHKRGWIHALWASLPLLKLIKLPSHLPIFIEIAQGRSTFQNWY